MWKSFLAGSLLVVTASAQTAPQLELANLREDVRGLTQRVGELALRVEQLERENGELRSRSSATEKSYITLTQLNEALSDITRSVRSAVSTAKAETLQQVSGQMEKLGKQTNAALESLTKTQAPRPVTPGSFSDDYPKDGISYTVVKGDNVASIAKKTGAKPQDILNANKISDPTRIAIGQTLFIPGGK